MYTTEEIRKYLDQEGITPRTLDEVERIAGLPPLELDKREDRYEVMASGGGEISVYDLLKSASREEIIWKLEVLQKLVGNLEGKCVLDAGCGTALEAVFLGSRMSSGHVYAVDSEEAMIARAFTRRQRYPSSRVKIGVADIHELPFSDKTFDHVLAFNCLTESARVQGKSFQDQVREKIRELRRVTKPLGDIIASGQYFGMLEGMTQIAQNQKAFEENGCKVIGIEDGQATVISYQGKTGIVYNWMMHAKRT